MSPSRSLDRPLLGVAIVVATALPLVFAGAFAGDAQVHLVFMESAAAGRFFEFNPGERVSGETSPGYMLIGAALFWMVGPAWVPVALKLLGLGAWCTLCLLVYRAALRLMHEDRTSAALAALVSAMLPGSLYNANVGMENGIFAALVWIWLLLAIEWKWFETPRLSHPREITLAALLGASFWLRPEAAVVAVCAHVYRLFRIRRIVLRSLTALLLTIVLGGGAILFQYAYTGDVVATSVLSRRVLALPHIRWVGPISIDPTFAIRLVAYFPLTALFIVGLGFKSSDRSAANGFLYLLFLTFFGLYSLNGVPQIARYAIFLMPILVIGAVRATIRIWHQAAPLGRLAVAIASLGQLGIWTAEIIARRDLAHSRQLELASEAPGNRQRRTDRLMEALGRPAERPVIVALESVQIRYEVDDRVIVRSLDGRVDRSLLSFVRKDRVDHVGYLHHRNVSYLLDTPNYSPQSSTWTLASLRDLPPGGSDRQGQLVFRRLPSGHGYVIENSLKGRR